MPDSAPDDLEASRTAEQHGVFQKQSQQQQANALSSTIPDESQHPTIVGQNVRRQQPQRQPQAFDMTGLIGDLPSTGRSPCMLRDPTGYPMPGPAMFAGNYAPGQQFYPCADFYDPTAIARMQTAQQVQQQQYMNIHPGQVGVNVAQNQARQMGYAMPRDTAYAMADPYAYAMSAAQYTPVDPRYAMSSFRHHTATQSDHAVRRSSIDTGPVPGFPRGPPRKPKLSGHALWVGNLPPATTVIDLKNHFSQAATDDIQSVFLISKSNCAFVNYRTEAACLSAMARFHDSRLHGARLVCRLRRGSVQSSAGPDLAESAGESFSTAPTVVTAVEAQKDLHSTETDRTLEENEEISQLQQPSTTDIDQSTELQARVPEKYFIVKSLTVQDLEASVRNQIWATQSHNEEVLNRAYEQADNVYLIFSANKSGEYFGYARMTSRIDGEPINLSDLTGQVNDEPASDLTGAPQSIPTAATATAPPGRIIDDSARGTIYWEAERGESEEALESEGAGSSDGQNWGRQFSIEWLSTTRLPFYRTRGLRNPLNANREVKIARDGTEVDPGVARRLIQMFHRSAPSPNIAGTASNPQSPY